MHPKSIIISFVSLLHILNVRLMKIHDVFKTKCFRTASSETAQQSQTVWKKKGVREKMLKETKFDGKFGSRVFKWFEHMENI